MLLHPAVFLVIAGFTRHAAAETIFPIGIIATGPQGPTNLPAPTIPTNINQRSLARLLSINSISDFCIFAPPQLANIGEAERDVVAWCTQPRNNARVISDGTLTGVSFLRTPYYTQVIGLGNFSRINVAPRDAGGQLDPYGRDGKGIPVGGNVSSSAVDGVEHPFAEWQLKIDVEGFCLRVCTNSDATFMAKDMCSPVLDEMPCVFSMPGNYDIQGIL
ncbi:immunoreactive manno protein MP88 [Mycena rebaudengoi]|nr:immunoreactive manno protein MP88 [Mycena rebaudengoi]